MVCESKASTPIKGYSQWLIDGWGDAAQAVKLDRLMVQRSYLKVKLNLFMRHNVNKSLHPCKPTLDNSKMWYMEKPHGVNVKGVKRRMTISSINIQYISEPYTVLRGRGGTSTSLVSILTFLPTFYPYILFSNWFKWLSISFLLFWSNLFQYFVSYLKFHPLDDLSAKAVRSEERRVGKECCCRWWAGH